MTRLIAAILALLVCAQASAEELPRTHLKILGSLAGVRLYKDIEEPFWTKRVPALSHGRVTAEIAPFDESGVKPREMVQMLRLGVIPFGTILLALASADDPEVLVSDLAGMNPAASDIHSAASAVAPYLARLYRERYGIEILATLVYPAQVVFCAKPLGGLASLKGRTVRVGGVSQYDFVEALGAMPVNLPFAEAVDALRKNVVECVITGALSGNQVGLHKLTTHIHDMALGWGISIFAANADAWRALNPAVRAFLSSELSTLQEEAWRAAAVDTERGLECNVGKPECADGERGQMIRVRSSPEDEALRRRIVAETVLPRWLQRCGESCAALWRDSIGPEVVARAQ